LVIFYEILLGNKVALYIFYKFGVHIGPMLSKGAIDLTSCWCFFYLQQILYQNTS